VGLVSLAGDEFLENPMYYEIANNTKIDIAGVRFAYDKMPLLKVWYPNDERKLTIGMIWDENYPIERSMIPDIYLKSDSFLFMPMINEIPTDILKYVHQRNPEGLKFIDVQGIVRFLKDARATTPDEWLGMPQELVDEWISGKGARRVYYDRSGELPEVLKYTDIIKANEAELSILSGVNVDTTSREALERTIEEGVSEIVACAGSVSNEDIVITITLGSLGAYVSYLDSQGERCGELIRAVRARKEDINPTGAGDTYSVAFLIAHRKSGDPVLATKYALAASSLGIEKEGPRDRPPKEEIYYRMIEFYGIK
jgi:hypothetical protein